MKVMYLGRRKVKMTDKKTGELIEGTTVFYAYADASVDGQASGKFFVRKGSEVELPQVDPGEEMNIEFNQYGKVCDCSAAS